jgi:hypothetical protein
MSIATSLASARDSLSEAVSQLNDAVGQASGAEPEHQVCALRDRLEQTRSTMLAVINEVGLWSGYAIEREE